MRLARTRKIVLGSLISVVAAAALTVLEAVTFRIQFLSSGMEPDAFRWVVARIAPVWLIFVALLWGVRFLVRRYPVERPHIARAIAVHTAAAAVFPVMHMGILGGIRVLNGEWISPRFLFEVMAYYYVRGVGLYVFAATAFHAAQKAREARDRRVAEAELQASLARARLETLRNQLSPHFLFNVLNSVAMLVRADRNEDALSMLSEFSDLLRDFLRQPQSELVSLADEMRFAERYLGLQQTRFFDRLRVSFDVDAMTRDRVVPSFVLYPLVENAVKHGIGKTPSGGQIVVRAHGAADRLVLEVEDDGPGFPASVGPESSGAGGVGLANLRARLAGIYGDDASLDLDRRDGRRSVARVTLPWHPAAARTVATV